MIVLRQKEFKSYQDGRNGQATPDMIKELDSLSSQSLKEVIKSSDDPVKISSARIILRSRKSKNQRVTKICLGDWEKRKIKEASKASLNTPNTNLKEKKENDTKEKTENL